MEQMAAPIEVDVVDVSFFFFFSPSFYSSEFPGSANG